MPETRSTASLTMQGDWRYAADANTEPLCLCYAVDDGDVANMDRTTSAVEAKPQRGPR
jgi:hypothetical protein